MPLPCVRGVEGEGWREPPSLHTGTHRQHPHPAASFPLCGGRPSIQPTHPNPRTRDSSAIWEVDTKHPRPDLTLPTHPPYPLHRHREKMKTTLLVLGLAAVAHGFVVPMPAGSSQQHQRTEVCSGGGWVGGWVGGWIERRRRGTRARLAGKAEGLLQACHASINQLPTCRGRPVAWPSTHRTSPPTHPPTYTKPRPAWPPRHSPPSRGVSWRTLKESSKKSLPPPPKTRRGARVWGRFWRRRG